MTEATTTGPENQLVARFSGSAAHHYEEPSGADGWGVIPYVVTACVEEDSSATLVFERALREVCRVRAERPPGANWRQLRIKGSYSCDAFVGGGRVVIDSGQVDFGRHVLPVDNLQHSCRSEQEVLTALLQGTFAFDGPPGREGRIRIDFQGGCGQPRGFRTRPAQRLEPAPSPRACPQASTGPLRPRGRSMVASRAARAPLSPASVRTSLPARETRPMPPSAIVASMRNRSNISPGPSTS